jgi:hypothetical protein
MSNGLDDAVVTAAPERLAWRLLLVPALAQLLLHLFTNGNYGIFRDEYYYLACAARPAIGYVDHPPLSIWILNVWTAVFGDSIHSLRVLPALCGSTLVFLTGAMAAEMGGRRWSQMIAGSAAAIGAVGLVLCGFYSMNAFDFLFWVGAYLVLLRIVRTGDGRLWPVLGVLLGVGLTNKIGLLVFGLALVLGILATGERKHLRDRRLYGAGAIALAFLLPYTLWNMAHDWVTLEFIRNAQMYKISAMSPLEFLKENVLEANPANLILWACGLGWLLARRNWRIIGLMFVFSFIIMVMQSSKPYYLGPSFLVLMAAGAVAWEGWTRTRGWAWVRWLLAVNVIAGAIVFLPLAVPVLSLEGSVQYMQKLGIVPQTGEDTPVDEAPQYFSDRFGWEELAQTVDQIYNALTEEEREKCVIVATNYGHGGALEYWARRHDYPTPVYAFHNNYWLWGPPTGNGEVVIAIDFRQEDMESLFDEVVEADIRVEPRARESHIRVWLCRGLRKSWADVWEGNGSFI